MANESSGGDNSERNDLIYLKKCKHGTFALLQHDFISYAMQLYGQWAEQEIELFATIVKPGDTIFEVGGHIGALTVPLARLVGPTGKVYAFEPQHLPGQALNANVLINALRNVRVYPYVVAAQTGTVRLVQHTFTHSVNSGAYIIRNQVNQETGDWTEVVPLDAVWNALGKPPVRLLKIGVEGMEPDVFSGGLTCIREVKPVLFLDNNFWKYQNSDAVGDAFYETVKAEGYSLFWYCSRGFREKNFFNATENVLGTAGDICVVAYPKGQLPKKKLAPFINCGQVRAGTIQWID